MLEPVTFIAPLGTWEVDVEKSEFQVEWWWWWGGWWWWCWWWWWWWWRDTAKGLLREETHQAYGESSLWGGGSLSPGRSGIRGPARPFASQSKTQGSPLGGYLSWYVYTCMRMYVCMHLCINVLNVCIQGICAHVRVYVYVHVHVYVYIHMQKCLHIYVNVTISVYVYIYIYMYMYVCY